MADSSRFVHDPYSFSALLPAAVSDTVSTNTMHNNSSALLPYSMHHSTPPNEDPSTYYQPYMSTTTLFGSTVAPPNRPFAQPSPNHPFSSPPSPQPPFAAGSEWDSSGHPPPRCYPPTGQQLNPPQPPPFSCLPLPFPSNNNPFAVPVPVLIPVPVPVDSFGASPAESAFPLGNTQGPRGSDQFFVQNGGDSLCRNIMPHISPTHPTSVLFPSQPHQHTVSRSVQSPSPVASSPMATSSASSSYSASPASMNHSHAIALPSSPGPCLPSTINSSPCPSPSSAHLQRHQQQQRRNEGQRTIFRYSQNPAEQSSPSPTPSHSPTPIGTSSSSGPVSALWATLMASGSPLSRQEAHEQHHLPQLAPSDVTMGLRPNADTPVPAGARSSFSGLLSQCFPPASVPQPPPLLSASGAHNDNAGLRHHDLRMSSPSFSLPFPTVHSPTLTFPNASEPQGHSQATVLFSDGRLSVGTPQQIPIPTTECGDDLLDPPLDSIEGSQGRWLERVRRYGEGAPCDHVMAWRRLRWKKGVNQMLCRECGAKWRAAKIDDDVEGHSYSSPGDFQ